MIVALVLAYNRNIHANILQSIMGATLFGTRANKSIHAIMSRIGLSVAYSTTVDRLHALGHSAKLSLLEIGRRVVAGLVYIHTAWIWEYRVLFFCEQMHRRLPIISALTTLANT